jgi:uncharacterized protein YpmB
MVIVIIIIIIIIIIVVRLLPYCQIFEKVVTDFNSNNKQREAPISKLIDVQRNLKKKAIHKEYD